MYPIHKTEGIILASKNIGEANRYFWIYTKDFGLVGATAQGVRKINSKLRFSLQDFSVINLEMVEGRQIWRITNAKLLIPGYQFSKDEKFFTLVNNICRLVMRLCQGEERNEKLFMHLKDIYSFFEKGNWKNDELKNFECVVVLRILESLGYIGDGKNISIFVTDVLSKEVIEKAGKSRHYLIEEINKSLKHSHL
ncbi:MAG: repair protein RecO protein [Candidatus Nomurabacteria bacterium GW2011_GWB1_37_5]|uniref:Repair protein RecO protein n=1 Tax=Candidatus Nomurabacteria bacterium GW2011_GWB1_37_5 TaxID=1618742 RepID=A0A0G0K0N8_9BACT|nr:MAG: repair protein RecO protein [Candidatus Nomurabacteria bacterium GW2011_GWB1_37_5]